MPGENLEICKVGEKIHLPVVVIKDNVHLANCPQSQTESQLMHFMYSALYIVACTVVFLVK